MSSVDSNGRTRAHNGLCFSKRASDYTRRSGSNEWMCFIVIKTMLSIRQFPASVRHFIMIGLCCGPLQVLGHEMIPRTQELTAERTTGARTALTPSKFNDPPPISNLANFYTSPGGNSRPAFGVEAGGHGEPDGFIIEGRTAVGSHLASEKGTRLGRDVFSLQSQDTPGRKPRPSPSIEFRPVLTGSTEFGPNSGFNTKNSKSACPLSISRGDPHTRSPYYTVSLTPYNSHVPTANLVNAFVGVSARQGTRRCDSTASHLEGSDRTGGVSFQAHRPSLAAGQSREVLKENYQYEERYDEHEFSRHDVQLGRKQRINPSYKPETDGNSPAELRARDILSNDLTSGRTSPTFAGTYSQAAPVTRFLAADATFDSPIPVAQMEKDVQQLLAAGSSETAHVNKEAMGLLSGVRGRSSGRAQGLPRGRTPVYPGIFPYNYSPLTPQQTQMLMAQQVFQLHPPVQYQRRQLPGAAWESESQQPSQQESQPFSPSQLMQQYQHLQREQDQQYQQQRAMASPPYNAPQQLMSGAGERSGVGRRFSRDGLRPRQQHRLQRQIHQQQRQVPQQPFRNGFMPNAWYFGNVPFNGAGLPTDGAPAAGSPYTPPNQAYTGGSATNGSNMHFPQDPNLLPLHYPQQRTERERLETQLRNQHDAWRARDQSSV